MLQELEDAIDEERVVQWEAMGQKFVVDAKRQMVAVQLEADFRSRLTAVYNEVKATFGTLKYDLSAYLCFFLVLLFICTFNSQMFFCLKTL